MGKNQNDKQLPASVPGAVPLPPDSEAISELPPAFAVPEVPESTAPDSEVRDFEAELAAAFAKAPSRAKYRVANLFQGFREQDLHEGDVIEADEDEAAPYVGKDGVLTRIEDEA